MKRGLVVVVACQMLPGLSMKMELLAVVACRRLRWLPVPVRVALLLPVSKVPVPVSPSGLLPVLVAQLPVLVLPVRQQVFRWESNHRRDQ